MQMDTRIPKGLSVAVAAALGALALAAVATAAYTKPTLKVAYGAGQVTRITATADIDEDSTARAAIYLPAGTTLTTNQPAGTAIGKAKAMVSALQLGGALVPFEGDIVVAAPGQVASATQALCTQGQTPAAIWVLVLQAVRQTINLPAFLLPTAGAETALGPAKLVICLPPPDVPVAQGGATFGAKFVQAVLTVQGVFSPAAAGAWLGVWTPYAAGGQVNAPGTVASPAVIAPGQITLEAVKRGRVNTRLTGQLTQQGQPTSGTVTILAGRTSSSLQRVATVRVSAKGTFAFTVKRKAEFFRVTGAAAVRSAPTLCAALTGLPAPCVNATLSGFATRSPIARRPG